MNTNEEEDKMIEKRKSLFNRMISNFFLLNRRRKEIISNIPPELEIVYTKKGKTWTDEYRLNLTLQNDETYKSLLEERENIKKSIIEIEGTDYGIDY